MVIGEASPDRHSCRHAVPPARRPARPRAPPGCGGSGSVAAASHAQAIRQGSRIACSPPGMRDRPQMGCAAEVAEVPDQELAAPDRAVGAVAGAVEDHPDHRSGLGRARPCSWPRARDGAARRGARRSSRSCAYSRRRVVGMQVVGDHSGVIAKSRSEVLDAGLERHEAPRSDRGRRCGGRPRRAGREPGERALELPAAAPASAGRRTPAASGCGARSRASGAACGSLRGPPARPRATPSRRTRRWIGRSWTRNRSAIRRAASSASSSS